MNAPFHETWAKHSDYAPDLKTFPDPPRKLFAWNLATIDAIVRREEDRYYAILKDERYPTLDWPTGKMIRICSSPNLLGPYSEPGPPQIVHSSILRNGSGTTR